MKNRKNQLEFKIKHSYAITAQRLMLLIKQLRTMRKIVFSRITRALIQANIIYTTRTSNYIYNSIFNFYKFFNNLTIIPVINKIDLPSADVLKVKKERVETPLLRGRTFEFFGEAMDVKVGEGIEGR